MDRLAVLAGSAVGATTVTVAVVRVGTPEAVLVALLAAGVATGALSREFQSEFLDAFFAGASAANRLTRSVLDVGLLAYLAALGFSVVPGLCAAAGGGVGARLQYAVRDRRDA